MFVEYNRNQYEKFKRVAQNFARSLLSEGYIRVLEYSDDRQCLTYIKMRHKTNKNYMLIWSNDDGFTVKKNGKIIKQESAG
jgi:hypothetical protein